MADAISRMPKMKKSEFVKRLNNEIRFFPGNATKKNKTINNWRTEISSLFALVGYDRDADVMYSEELANKLAWSQDLMHFFKVFLFTFQYPGGHLKSYEAKECIGRHIRFKPAKYLLELLVSAEREETREFINKAEATHCIFNDLRVTAEGRSVSDTLKIIRENRTNGLSYDWAGDKIRYAGDILDYLVYANLLKRNGQKYYINMAESEAISVFLEDTSWFGGYDFFYNHTFESQDLTNAQDEWFSYVNKTTAKVTFETDILSLIGLSAAEIKKPNPVEDAEIQDLLEQVKVAGQPPKTKEIGDKGESLIYGHECMRLKKGGREELVASVMPIPNQFKMGYDIRSFELDKLSNHRLIEVKTSISTEKLDFNQFRLTENEWNAAQSYLDKYYVYRLVINKSGHKLFVIRNPVEKYKKDLVTVTLSNGALVKFTDRAGDFEELLLWKE